MPANTISHFYASANFRHDNEVSLFRKLATAIQTTRKAIFIDETHGANVCNVEFDSITGSIERCEISDLLIMVVHPQLSYIRVTFWQAKKETNPKWVNISRTDNTLDFKAQSNQWELLAYRPQIRSTPTFNPPSDLLSSFKTPSIGSYGTFYHSNSKIEVAYSIAEMVSCTNPHTANPKCTINGLLDKYFLFGHEKIITTSLHDFLYFLFHFHVGALIDRSHPSHTWLLSYINKKLLTKGYPSLGDFFGSSIFPPDTLNPLPDLPDLTGFSLLLITATDDMA